MGTRRILITGASGLVGRAVAERLAARDEVVTIGRRPVAIAGVRHLTADLSAPGFAAQLPDQIDAVIFLAQSERYAEFPAAARDIFAINLEALANTLDWARRSGAKVFVYASTGGIYGTGDRPFRESDSPRIAGPLSFYFHTKLAGENLAASYRECFEVINLRPFFVYGPGQHRDRWLPRLFARVRQRQAIRLSGDDGIRLNPVHVSDAAAAIERSLALGSDTLNIAGPRVVSMRQIGDMIGRTLGVSPLYEHTADAAGDLVGDIGRMEARLGAPAIRLDEALSALAEGEGW